MKEFQEKLRRELNLGDDQFFVVLFSTFIIKTYTDWDKGLEDLKELQKNSERFNEFSKTLIAKQNDQSGVKEEFFGRDNSSNQEFGNTSLQNVGTTSLTNVKKEKVSLMIINRYYNGKYGKGSIFKKNYKIEMDGEQAVSYYEKEVCIDSSEKNHAKINVSIPFKLTSDQENYIYEFVNKIKYNNEYTEKEGEPIPVYYSNIGIEINGSMYKMSIEEFRNLSSKLLECMVPSAMKKIIDDFDKDIQ